MKLWQKILKRLLETIVVLIGVSIISFLLLRISGGDPVDMILPREATPEERQMLRDEMGLDKPLVEQYLTYMGNVLHGNLGHSYAFNLEINQLIGVRLPQTLKLGLFAICISLCVAFPLGIIAGINKGSAIDMFAMFFAIFGQSMAEVWLAIMLVLIFSVKLQWLPTQGMDSFRHFILPGICMSFSFTAGCTRMLRSGMVEVIEEDYITATRARGTSDMKVNTKYALKNALMPVVTMIGSRIGMMVSGAVIIENVFAWPGIGQLLVFAIQNRDYQLVQSVMLICATIMVFCNLAADLAYTIIDPRVSFN